MAFATSVKSSKAISSIIVDTKSALEGMTKIAPAGIWFLESDTGAMKVSDGATAYASLSYKVEALFTSSFKTLLDNANAANGVAKLDNAGKLTMDMLPTELTSTVLSGAVKYVADIAARDTLTEKGGLVIVVDASADASVTAGTAGYSWDGSAWTKVFESESMDVSLADYFAMSVNTLDDVTDGTTYIRMAKTWKESVDSDLADLKGRLTTAEGTLVTHGTAIEAAQSAADTAQGEVDALEGVVATLTQTVADNKSAADTGIQEAKDAASTADGKAVAAQGAIDAHKTQYATDKAALEAAIATADGKGAQGIADAAAALAAAQAAQGDVDALEEVVGDSTKGLVKSIADNAGAISALEEVVDGLSGGTATDLTDLKNRMTAVEGVAASNTTLAQKGVDDAAGALAAAQAAQGDVDAVEGRMDTAESEIDTLQANAFQTTDTIYFAPMTAAELQAALA